MNNGYESADEAEDIINNSAGIQQHPAIIKPRKKLYRKKTHKTHNMQLARHDPINKLCTVKSQLLVHPEGVRLMDFRSSIGVYDKSTPRGKSVNQLSIKRISPHRVPSTFNTVLKTQCLR